MAPATGLQRKKVTINTLKTMHKKNEPITMITAHDFPSGHVADAAGMDMVLVGDSLAMVALGMEDTSEIVLEEMLLHCRSVARAAKAAFTVCTTRFTGRTEFTNICIGWRSSYGVL
jgi:3-methyl-2-oxobutanoate hydroxymethyltransferase